MSDTKFFDFGTQMIDAARAAAANFLMPKPADPADELVFSRRDVDSMSGGAVKMTYVQFVDAAARGARGHKSKAQKRFGQASDAISLAKTFAAKGNEQVAAHNRLVQALVKAQPTEYGAEKKLKAVMIPDVVFQEIEVEPEEADELERELMALKAQG